MTPLDADTAEAAAPAIALDEAEPPAPAPEASVLGKAAAPAVTLKMEPAAEPAKVNTSYRRIFGVSYPALMSLFFDQMGFAFMFPTLPDYLASNNVVGYETWVGAILCSQFFGNTLGSVAIGRLADVKSSKLALQVSMLFDVVFFALSAMPFMHPAVLLVIRFFVGFSSPVSTSLTFMFDRLPPECIPKAVTLFMTCGISAYMVGNLLIGVVHSTLRWEGECFVSAAGALIALITLQFRSTPSNRVGVQPRPEGVGRVLVAPELVSGALAQLMMGCARARTRARSQRSVRVYSLTRALAPCVPQTRTLPSTC